MPAAFIVKTGRQSYFQNRPANLELLAHLRQLPTGALTPTIRMKHHILRDIPAQRVVRTLRLFRQIGALVIIHRPTNHTTGMSILDGTQAIAQQRERIRAFEATR